MIHKVSSKKELFVLLPSLSSEQRKRQRSRYCPGHKFLRETGKKTSLPLPFFPRWKLSNLRRRSFICMYTRNEHVRTSISVESSSIKGGGSCVHPLDSPSQWSLDLQSELLCPPDASLILFVSPIFTCSQFPLFPRDVVWKTQSGQNNVIFPSGRRNVIFS